MNLIKNTLRSRCAFSMIEVIVAAVLFAVSAASIFAAISNTNTAVISNSRLKAALFAKKILDGLNKEVSPAGWAAALSIGAHGGLTDAAFSGCTASYTVVADATGARKVDATAICP